MTNTLNDLRFREALSDVTTCLLCGSERLEYRACFVPTSMGIKLAIREPPGKTRVLFYGLCDDCAAALGTPEFTNYIERVLIAKAQVKSLPGTAIR